MTNKLKIDVAVAAKWAQFMEEAGFCQADVDALSGVDGRALWPAILRVITGESALSRRLYAVAEIGMAPSFLSRMGQELYIDGSPLRILSCAEQAENVIGLVDKFSATARHPSAKVLSVLLENPHMLPQSWQMADHEEDRSLYFLSTWDKVSVKGIYLQKARPPSVTTWDFDGDDCFDRYEYIVVY